MGLEQPACYKGVPSSRDGISVCASSVMVMHTQQLGRLVLADCAQRPPPT